MLRVYLQHWKLKLVCELRKKIWNQTICEHNPDIMFCFSSKFFLFLFNISCPSQKIKSMSFMTFSYKRGHIKWLLLPFLWKCQESKNIYSKTIFSFYPVSLVLSRTSLFTCFHIYKIWIFKSKSSLWKINVSWFTEKYIKCSMIWIYTYCHFCGSLDKYICSHHQEHKRGHITIFFLVPLKKCCSCGAEDVGSFFNDRTQHSKITRERLWRDRLLLCHETNI